MDCKELEDLLSDRVLAELAPGERVAVAAHVATCRACRERHGLDEESQDLHDTVKVLRAGSDITTTVMARLDLADVGAGADAEPKDDPAVPERLGGFEVLGFLGRGGMGNVFKARQISMDRLVALKILPARLASDEEFVKRLTREARAAARLRHPNIVQAHDVGQANGHYYFAMEYVNGEGLDAILCREGPLEPDRARQVMMQVASALAAAHAKGIIHGDIKPSNVMLDSGGEVRVTDFGLAKHTEGDGAAAADAQAVGTPAYVAPEILTGKAVDARADLYSLGATFFHLLTGRPPFQAQSFSGVIVKQLKEPAPPLRGVAPHVSVALGQVIDRLLRKDPDERYPSAEALLDELKAFGDLTSLPTVRPNGRATVMDAPTPTISESQRLAAVGMFQGPWWAGRRRIALVAAAGIVFAVLGLGAFYAFGPRRPSDEPPQAARATGLERPAPARPSPGELREAGARSIFERAQHLALQGRWLEAKGQLSQLESQYADTGFYAAHEARILELRAEADDALRPKEVAARPIGPPEAAKPTPHPARPREVVLPVPEPPKEPGQWVSLFDGKTLAGWRVAKEAEFGGGGQVRVQAGRIVLDEGGPMTGIAWTGEFPRIDYEVELEAMRVAGKHDFASMTFPFGNVHCCYQVSGSEGASLVGLSNVDGRRVEDPENVTRKDVPFENRQWYRLRLRVTEPRIEAWIDDEKVTDFATAGHTLTHHDAVPPLAPFGIHSWGTKAALRNIRVRRLRAEPDEALVAEAHRGGPVATALVTVPARSQWFDSGLDVEMGGAYRFAASGRWGASPEHTGGPEGQLQGRAPGKFPVPGVPMYALIGRVGLEGKPFVIAARHETAAAEAGRLFMMMNDPGPDDNWGSVAVVVNGPLVAAPAIDGESIDKGAIAVPARADWLDSGLHVTRGGYYRLTAKGQWGTSLVHTGGPEGGPEADPADKLQLPGAPPNGLIARVGLNGEPFVVARSAGRVAKQSGRLFLRMNDADLNENWGSIRVEVDGPLIADWRARLLSRFARELPRLSVSAANDFTPSAIDVEPGDVLLIQAEGQWNPGDRACDANGMDADLEGCRRGMLVGRIGEGGEPIAIGALHVLEAPAAGKLYLAMNDGDRGDNTGSVQVTVRAFELPGPPKLPEEPGVWASLFNGRSLHGWRAVSGGEFAGRRRVLVEPGRIVLLRPAQRAAIAWTGEFPTVDYELSLELMREDGPELCEMLFPVGSERCAWNVGGWGGAQTGLSMVDAVPGDRNDTNGKMACRDRQWYRLRLRVTAAKIEGWRDGEKCIDLSRAARRFTQPDWLPIPEPFALTTWRTTLGIRNIRVQRLESKPEEPPADGAKTEAAAVAVSAREGWQNTGLYLTKGKRYTISAAGRWGVSAVLSCGPEGRRREEFRPYPLFGERVLDLVGRLGPQGWPFRIGSRLELTAAQSGRLFLRMNDDETANNWGSLRADIRGPMLADKTAALLSRLPKTVAKVQVRSGGGWVSSGVELRRGDRVLLSAKGSWRQRAGQPPIGPNGLNRSFKHLRAGALLGRVGPHGARFVVGELHLLEAAEDGELYLTINDVARARVIRDIELELMGREPGAPRGRIGDRTVPGGPIVVPAGEPAALNLIGRALRRLREAQLRAKAMEARRAAVAAAEEARRAAAEADAAPPPAPRAEQPIELNGWPAQPAPAPVLRRGPLVAAPRLPRPTGALEVTVSASAEFEQRHKQPDESPGPPFRLLTTLKGHRSWVICVGFSPDGTQLASGSRDRTARLWDTTTWRALRTLPGHQETIESVAFSPDGTRLVSGSRDRSLGLWDVATGRRLKTLLGHGDHVLSVASFPDGKRAASTGDDQTVRIWDLATGQWSRILPCDDASWSVAVSPDGRLVAMAGSRGWIRIWDAETGRIKQAFFAQMSNSWCLVFSPDGKRLAVGGDDPIIRVWDVVAGKRLATLKADRMTRGLAFSPDGKWIAAGGGYRAVRIWDATTYEHVRSLEDHTSEIRGLAFSPDGTRLATASFDRTIKIWTLNPDDQPAPRAALEVRHVAGLTAHASAVLSLAVSPDGNWVATGGKDKTVKVAHLRQVLFPRTLAGHTNVVPAVAFSLDGKQIASGSLDKSIRLWDLATGRCLRTLEGHQRGVTSVAFLPDGKRLASSSTDGTFRIWDLATGTCARVVKADPGVASVAVSPDGTRLATAGALGHAKVWDLATGRRQHDLVCSSLVCWSVAFAPDGKRLASVGQATTVKLWDLATGKRLKALEAGALLRSIALSPDGKWLAAAGPRGALRVWNSHTFEALGAPKADAVDYSAVAFLPDSKRLATAGADGTVRIWALLPPGAAPPKPDKPKATPPGPPPAKRPEVDGKAPPPGQAVPDRTEPVEPRGGAVPAAPPRAEPRPR